MKDQDFCYDGIDSTDFYAYSDWKRLQEIRSEQEYCLLKRIQAGSEDARYELTMHREENDELRNLAWSCGYNWE